MTLVARGVIVHENECLQCQNFHTSLAGWCTYSAEESDAFPVLFCTAAGSYIALNDVQMANNKHGHDTPHCDLSYIRNKCKLITYLFVIFFILSMKFFAHLCHLAFISFISFCFLRGRQACIPTVNRHQRTVRALTLKPVLRQLCTILLTRLLSVSFFIPSPKYSHLKLSSTYTFSFCCKLFTARNFPANSAHRQDTNVIFFLQYLYQNRVLE